MTLGQNKKMFSVTASSSEVSGARWAMPLPLAWPFVRTVRTWRGDSEEDDDDGDTERALADFLRVWRVVGMVACRLDNTFD